MTWTALVDELPPEGEVVDTKIDDSRGVRNVQPLKRSRGLFFFPDGSMYVYYTPTHWRQRARDDRGPVGARGEARWQQRRGRRKGLADRRSGDRHASEERIRFPLDAETREAQAAYEMAAPIIKQMISAGHAREPEAEYENLKKAFREAASNADRARRDREETGRDWGIRAEYLSTRVRDAERALDAYVARLRSLPEPETQP